MRAIMHRTAIGEMAADNVRIFIIMAINYIRRQREERYELSTAWENEFDGQ